MTMDSISSGPEKPQCENGTSLHAGDQAVSGPVLAVMVREEDVRLVEADDLFKFLDDQSRSLRDFILNAREG